MTTIGYLQGFFVNQDLQMDLFFCITVIMEPAKKQPPAGKKGKYIIVHRLTLTGFK